MQAIKVAAVQASPVFMNLSASIDKAESIVAEAAKNGASLVAFPETWLPGFPWFVYVGTPADAMAYFPEYHDNSLVVGSKEHARMQYIAKKYEVTLVMGFSENHHGSRYMAQTIIDPSGEILLNRRKLKPTHIERTVFGEGDGSDLVVVDAPFGRLGALNCWEHVQPLVKMAMFSQNEEVHVASWPSLSIYRDIAYSLGPEVNNGASMVYAVEGGCFVIAPCAVITQEMFDKVCKSPEHAKLLNPTTSGPGGGFSMIYAPNGRPLCDPLPEDEEGILYADLDPTEITLAKAVADPVGHYARGDALKLLWNREKRVAVQEVGAAISTAPLSVETSDAEVTDQSHSEDD